MSLYSEIFYSPQINSLFSEQETVAAMLRFEATLAMAQAECNIVPHEAAQIISDCCKIENIDIEKLKKDIILSGNAAIPLVKQLTQVVKIQDIEAAKYVHLGATSQDVIDSGIALQIQSFVVWLEEKLSILEQILVKLTKKHRQTMMVGRTLLQQAKPITFGLKMAFWLQRIQQTRQQLADSQKYVLVLKLGGAVGSGNEYINKKVQLKVASMSGLNPSIGGQWGLFACSLGILVGYLGKIAKDVSLLMQTEVGEVFEGAGEGKGGSSTMPHKRNPVTTTAMLANANRVPALVATMLTAMPQEHERSVGLWHSEWETLSQIIQLTAGSVERGIELIERLEIDKDRMLQNLELTQGLIYAETVSLALAKKIGKTEAHEIIENACKSAILQKKHLKTVLEEMQLDLDNLEELFKPENSIGNSLEIIDDILSNYQ